MRTITRTLLAGLVASAMLIVCLAVAGCNKSGSGGVSAAEKNAPPPAGGTNAGKPGGTGTAPPVAKDAAAKTPDLPGK